jgi:xanthine dehydrogenase accessory factor
MKEVHLWEFIYSNLKKNNSVILVIVVNHKKGSPGKEGFAMAVSSTGDSVGSIGGGIMEYNILKKCKILFEKKIIVNEIETLYHNKKTSAKQSGLICAGSQTNLTRTFTKKDIAVVKKILDSVKQNKAGRITYTGNGISFSSITEIIPESNFTFKNNADWKFRVSTGTKNIIYIIGGGHVGLALSKVMSLLEFFVIVYDSRDDLRIMKENKFADRKIIDSYKNIGKVIKEDSYIAIVTTGFESDKEAVEQVINKNVRYIGLMGTKAKIKKIFNEAVKDGVRKELLNKIHAPIGIDIDSDTPEEIAISIAAEIIREKNKIS